VAAQHGVVGGNPLADREPVGCFPERIDTTDDLMAGRQRVLREEAPVMDMEVGPAHAGHLDCEADLSDVRLRRRNRPYVELSRSTIDDGSHLANAVNAV
jgi:hypothetical protein